MCSFRVHNWCRRRNISRNMEATHSFCHDPRERGCWLELSDRWRGGNAQIGFGCRNKWVDLMCSTEIKDRSVSDSQSLAGVSERVIMSIMKTGGGEPEEWRGFGDWYL